MPKLKPTTQQARRGQILDAAERCFATSGFHRSTMQDICKAAGVSPGALYVYFDSKEALIAGIAERDRAEFAERMEMLAHAPDLLEALSALGEQYFVEEPAHKRRMCVEIGLESTRNPRVGEIFRAVDGFVRRSFRDLFQRMKNEGRIAADVDVGVLADVLMLMGDGMFWRRAVHPDFDARATMPAIMTVLSTLMKPVDPRPVDTPATKVPS